MNVVILTGAGISAESGLATFRDAGGVWSQVRLEDVATPEAFARDPAKVQGFYNARRRQAAAAEPNAAHFALARLLDAGDKVQTTLVTQNVDSLHEAAGASGVIHMHGRLDRGFCTACHAGFDATGDLSTEDVCPSCGAKGTLRPDIVWFGEMPYHMDEIEAALMAADVFVSIGTSGQVYPAAGFVEMAKACQAITVEVNLEGTGNAAFDAVVEGPASQTVPALVEALLTGQDPLKL